MVKSVAENYQAIDVSVPASSRKGSSIKYMAIAITALAAVTAVSFFAMNNDSAQFESLNAGDAPHALNEAAPEDDIKYGEYITLKNVYNEYVLVGHSGRAYTGGYHGQFDRIQILSASSAQGQVQYGDKVLLVGQNDKYFAAQNSGKVTCRLSKSARKAEFTILGGSGPVKVGDRAAFKTFFGWMTATRGGIRGDTEELTSMEKYGIGRVHHEDGVHGHSPLQYGMAISLRNRFSEYLQTGPNGWVFIKSNNGDWDKFDVLSPVHRKGVVRYGDSVILRGHNGNMVMVRDGGLSAWRPGERYHTTFELIGGTGPIHNGAGVALRSPSGFVNAEMAGARANVDKSGHYNPGQNFEVVFANPFDHFKV